MQGGQRIRESTGWSSGMDLLPGGVKRRSKGEENLLLPLAGADTAVSEGS